MRAAAGIGLVLAVLAVAGCGGKPGKPLSDGALAKLVLQKQDLGPGFNRFAEGREIGAELGAVFRGDRARFGRQDGWVARYRHTGTAAGSGPLTVAAVIEVFDRPSGASDYLEALRKYDDETAPSTGLREVDLPELGDEAHGVATAKGPRGSVRYFNVTWRNGRFAGSVSASGFASRLGLEDMIALARRQEKRISRAR